MQTQLTNMQLYVMVGLPTVVAIVGILVNVGYFVVMNSRILALEAKVTGMAEQQGAQKALLDIVLKKLDELESRFHR